MAAVHQHRFPNGLCLVAEPIASAQSLALTLLVPAGVAAEPPGQLGVATLLGEMIFRGAGGLDARQHSDALDHLGVERGSSVLTQHLRLGATMIGSQFAKALPLLLDMVLRPALTAATLEPSRDLALQALDSLEDEPQQKLMEHLRLRHLPNPMGRSPLGRREDLEAISIKQLRQFWQQRCTPQGAILGIAGQFDWQDVIDRVGKLTESWQGSAADIAPGAPGPRGYEHQIMESAQVHLGLAYDSLPEPHVDSVLQRAAVAVLSGGMSGRLFTEVREKRGLCYSVYAGYSGFKNNGMVLAYAGTTPPRAQETYDVLRGELLRLSQGIDSAEFARAVVGMKSRLVMQGESTASRSYAVAADQYLLGRPRTLAELAARIDSVSLDQLNSFVQSHPPAAMTMVTIGPAPLKVAAEA